jgi:hypothetical protein
VCGEHGKHRQGFAWQQSACRRQEDPIAAPERQATAPAKHAQLVAKDQDLDLASSIIVIPAVNRRRSRRTAK